MTDLNAVHPILRRANKTKSERLAARREKHRSADTMRRNRMKSLLMQMQTLANADDNEPADQTSVLEAGVDIIRSLRRTNAELMKQLTVQQQQSPDELLQRAYSQHIVDIQSFYPMLDSMGIAIKRVNVNSVIIDINNTYAVVSDCMRESLVGHNLSNVPIRSTVYAIKPDHIPAYKELCHAQQGTNTSLTCTTRYHGEVLGQVGACVETDQFGAIFQHLFEKHASTQVLCCREKPNNWRTELLVHITPIFDSAGEPDHLVMLSTSDTRRSYRTRVSSTDVHVQQLLE